MKKQVKHNGPGRPAYVPRLPKKLKFTMADLCAANGIDPETGKGGQCSKLTLVKYVKSQVNNRKGLLCKVKGETADPMSETGLGRRMFLYHLRTRTDEIDKGKTPPAKTTPKTTTPADVSVQIGESNTSYDKTKEQLLGMTPAPVTDAPIVPTEEPVTA